MPIIKPPFDYPETVAIFQGIGDFLRDHLIDGVAAPERMQTSEPDALGVKYFSDILRFDGSASEAIEVGMSAREKAVSTAPDEQDHKPFLILGYDTERPLETGAAGQPLVNVIPVAIFILLPYRGREHIQADAEILDLGQDLVLFFLRQRFFSLGIEGQHGVIWRPPVGGQIAKRDLGFRRMNYDFVRVVKGF